ncbi:DUF2961 domain-containing protein [bacterium]|nr:MAG: DUF2961 domain-containing protein [bacterium]
MSFCFFPIEPAERLCSALPTRERMESYEKPKGVGTRWFSPENPTGEPGRAALENRGAKGRPYVVVPAGWSHTMMDFAGSGTVCRIWATIVDRSPEMLRGLRIEMFWDGAETPAVSVPFGDFFGVGLGQSVPFECALFSDPEGRSFNCSIPMPFRTGARIVVANDGERDLNLFFYDVDALVGVAHSEETLYFHSGWRRESPNRLGEEFAILPRIRGNGRFLGCNIGVIADACYESAWWGEGEVKVRMGEESTVTLCGTGTEDYIGTGWGQGRYAHRSQGCTVGDSKRGYWAFYRYHLDDPVFFDGGCEVTIQTIGGTSKEKTLSLLAKGVPLIPTTIDEANGRGMVPLLAGDMPIDVRNLDIENFWCNFWRQDDWSAVAYFYLDRPENGLPPLPSAAERSVGLVSLEEAEARADL